MNQSSFPVVAAPFLEDPYSPQRKLQKKKVVLGQGAFKGFLGMYIPQTNKAFFLGGIPNWQVVQPRGMTGWMTPKDLAKDDPFLGSEVGGVA